MWTIRIQVNFADSNINAIKSLSCALYIWLNLLEFYFDKYYA